MAWCIVYSCISCLNELFNLNFSELKVLWKRNVSLCYTSSSVDQITFRFWLREQLHVVPGQTVAESMAIMHHQASWKINANLHLLITWTSKHLRLQLQRTKLSCFLTVLILSQLICFLTSNFQNCIQQTSTGFLVIPEFFLCEFLRL